MEFCDVKFKDDPRHEGVIRQSFNYLSDLK